MTLCFIEPQDAIRVIAESVGREARRQLLGELVRAWVDEIPEPELESHYAKAVADLDEHDLSMLAAWHASLEVGHPIANGDFLINMFSSLGENRREALKIAAGFRGEEAFEAGVAEEQAMETVLPWLSRERAIELAAECVELYCWDRLGATISAERDEEERERQTRRMGELLQEIRVAQTGTQILFAFLLGVPFTQRFAQITSFERTVYYATVLSSRRARRSS